ncbi:MULTISPECIES: hypothetical protein [unclassified Mucilaginibacter]|uniref:hypothetical protein n=1 Tax=unclassified Mucilaginibacter TaxID=2617802 RepID=UPI002AC9A825|nr:MULTISPECIES: hypothetical protein [unclassified Mucilaginibacter]MEB0261120.1 hypothetical protein [Mucilaginibacter sp. 10I4]MEB0280495.1 hypothetical protein [Mucilaginibacter sp. 10B2]MEB0301299.1 hypothetical protein [Mucilaginibacter sp. 5C4]WPX22469.1 hypothetical protein RHM67_14380 [Mucilaginibacter sp. 5C4]
MKTNFKRIACYSLVNILLVTTLCLPFYAFGQLTKVGSIEYLKYCNGTNGIKLGTDFNMIPNYKLALLDGEKKVDADSCMKFEYKDAKLLKMDSDLNLDLIGIRNYKSKIVNIYLFL